MSGHLSSKSSFNSENLELDIAPNASYTRYFEGESPTSGDFHEEAFTNTRCQSAMLKLVGSTILLCAFLVAPTIMEIQYAQLNPMLIVTIVAIVTILPVFLYVVALNCNLIKDKRKGSDAKGCWQHLRGVRRNKIYPVYQFLVTFVSCGVYVYYVDKLSFEKDAGGQWSYNLRADDLTKERFRATELFLTTSVGLDLILQLLIKVKKANNMDENPRSPTRVGSMPSVVGDVASPPSSPIPKLKKQRSLSRMVNKYLWDRNTVFYRIVDIMSFSAYFALLQNEGNGGHYIYWYYLMCGAFRILRFRRTFKNLDNIKKGKVVRIACFKLAPLRAGVVLVGANIVLLMCFGAALMVFVLNLSRMLGIVTHLLSNFRFSLNFLAKL